MNDPILNEAKALQAQTVSHRRYLHQNAEVGHDLPMTRDYVLKQLQEMGYTPEEIVPCGIVATVGKPGKTILLRGDMDALPMPEETNLPFSSCTNAAHTCGHDIHTAMLLSAAKLLKQHEAELSGSVKLMFQPAEETINGAKGMVEAGILENPAVDGAFAIHVSSEHPSGVVYYRAGDIYASADGFSITIEGRGGHGAAPQQCIDPINIAVQIYNALQTIITREKSPSKQAVLTIGSIHGGSANNIIPEKVEMLGTMRTYDPQVRQQITQRITTMAETIAAMYGGKAVVHYFNGTPAMYADVDFTQEVVECLGEVLPAEHIAEFPIIFSGSEDFAEVAEKVPATMLMLGCAIGEDFYPHHHPKVYFDEAAMPYGVAAYVGGAIEWLKR